MVTTPTWLILIAALGGGVIGALISGALLILNNHLQSKRDTDRQQRDFERLTRMESLDRVKTAIEEGLNISNNLRYRTGISVDTILDYAIAVDGARVAAEAIEAQTLIITITALTGVMAELADAIKNKTPDSALAKVRPILVDMEKQYIELKVKL